MNRIHLWLCRSEPWRRAVEGKLLPWSLAEVELGDALLEIGPGPGLTSDVLRQRAARLTCLEIDAALAASLSERMRGTNVTVVEGDAAAMPFPAGSFSAVVAFTMLHHVPSAELQDGLLREAHRVLRPGGVFAGSDSTVSLGFRLLHIGDTMVPVDPGGFGARLGAAGFADVRVETGRGAFRFRAVRGEAATPAGR